MGVWNTLHGLVFEKDDSGAAKPATDPHKPIGPQMRGTDKAVPNYESTMPQPAQSFVPANPQAANDLMENFKKILEEANAKQFPGDDFYEYWITKQTLSAIPDEGMRSVSAFAVLANKPGVAQPLTRDKLLSTGDQYCAVMDNELKEFEEAFAQMYAKEVTGRQNSIEAKQKEMTDLSQRIQTLNGEIQALTTEKMQTENDLAQKKSQFEIVAGQMKNMLQSELEKIKIYIK